MSQIVHRVDSLICTPTNSNHLWSHWRTTMALHHSRLGLENKSGRIFLRLRSLFYKTLPSNLGVCKPTFIPFRHHIWGETILWGAVFIIQTSDRMQYFTIFQYQLHSFNIQHDRSTRGLLAKPLKKFPKLPIRLAGSHFCKAPKSTVQMKINRVIRFNIIKNLLICLFFI